MNWSGFLLHITIRTKSGIQIGFASNFLPTCSHATCAVLSNPEKIMKYDWIFIEYKHFHCTNTYKIILMMNLFQQLPISNLCRNNGYNHSFRITYYTLKQITTVIFQIRTYSQYPSFPPTRCEVTTAAESIIKYTYLLTPWSRVLLEKLTSKLCS